MKKISTKNSPYYTEVIGKHKTEKCWPSKIDKIIRDCKKKLSKKYNS